MRNRFQSFLLKLSTYNWRNFVLTSALISLIAIGTHLHKDYSVPSDEPVERMNGIVSPNYLVCLLGVYAVFRLIERRLTDFRSMQLTATAFMHF